MKKLSFLLIFFSLVVLGNANAHIEVSNSWARLIPNGMGALFLEIQNSHPESDILTQASSPNAKSVMIHQTERKNNITSMKHLMKGINIPANGNISLKPGSYHIMLSGLDKDLKLGDKIEVTLEFSKNKSITVKPVLKIKPPFYN
jgi:copper(I)-binding protein|tara:strand:+ start:203 stop:637 length:435 start_codon:yes stop_codon:yes gene_type:complete